METPTPRIELPVEGLQRPMLRTCPVCPRVGGPGDPPSSILVVDDDRDLVRNLAIPLQAHGYEVRTAYDGAAAEAEINARCPALVLSGWDLPRLSGPALAWTIWMNCSSIPIVYLGAPEHPDRYPHSCWIENPDDFYQVLAVVRGVLPLSSEYLA